MKTTKEKREVVEKVFFLVCRFFDVSTEESINGGRKEEYLYPRQVTHYFICEYMKHKIPLRIIGDVTGIKDHSTILHSCKKVINVLNTEPESKNNIDLLERKITPVIDKYLNNNFDYVI